MELAELGTCEEDQETVRLGALNELAFEDLILCIQADTKAGRVAFNLVKNCKTDDHPEGNFCLAWTRLGNKFCPKTAPTYVSLKKDFTNSSLVSSDEDPDEWITELENLRVQMDAVNISGKMSDVDFIIHVLANLLEEYESTVEHLEEKLEDTENPLDLETVRTKLNARFA